MTTARIDFDRLLKLRLVVARLGEMDLAKWWNTKGQLSRFGTATVRRGFSRTHYFVQARSVFRCGGFSVSGTFDPLNSVTLWQLPEAIEEEFDVHWEHCLDHGGQWNPFFLEIEALREPDLKAALEPFGLISDAATDLFPRLRRSSEGRAVPLPAGFTGTNLDVELLAVGFARGELGAPAIPYARLDNP